MESCNDYDRCASNYEKYTFMRKIYILFILLTGSQLTFGQSRAEKVGLISNEIHNKYPNVAISIGLIDSGKQYFFNYGKISRNSKVDVDENTIYEIGSTTKLFTANLIAQAQNEGKLKIDDFIDNYLPKDYKLSNDIKNKLKISDLASHQSGLPDLDFKKLMEINPKQPLDITKESIGSVFNDSTKLIDYGCYRYSNLSYILLGVILENVYHQDYWTLVKEKILVPTQMNSTFTTADNIKNKVVGYDINGNEQEYFNWNSLSAPAGLLKSNTADMTKLLDIILYGNGKISKTTAITEKTFFKNTRSEICFGQEVERNEDDFFFYKTGDTFACSSVIAYDKKTDWGIIIIINQHNSNLIRDLILTNYEKALK